MTVVAALLAAALVAVVYLLLRHRQAAERAWAAERRELLNRVQRPDHLPAAPVEHFEIPEGEPDGWALVGTIAEPEKEPE